MELTREQLVAEITSLTEQFATVQRQADQIIGARTILQRLVTHLDSEGNMASVMSPATSVEG